MNSFQVDDLILVCLRLHRRFLVPSTLVFGYSTLPTMKTTGNQVSLVKKLTWYVAV